MLAESLKRRSGSLYGSCRSSTPLTMLNIAVLAPIPRANVSIEMTANPGVLKSERVPRRISCQIVSIMLVSPVNTSTLRIKGRLSSLPHQSRSLAIEVNASRLPQQKTCRSNLCLPPDCLGIATIIFERARDDVMGITGSGRARFAAYASHSSVSPRHVDTPSTNAGRMEDQRRLFLN